MQTNEALFFLLLDLDNYYGSSMYDFNAKKALKHTYQLRGMANTVRMCTTIITWAVAATDSCFALLGGSWAWHSQYGHTCNHRPSLLLPRRMHKHPFKCQLHTKYVVAVGWELKNSSPTACI